MFIAVDGPDGCGKTVICKMLVDQLNNMGLVSSSISTPSTKTETGMYIRSYVLKDNAIRSLYKYRDRAVMFICDMRELAPMVMGLRNRTILVTDRWCSSTLVYQSAEAAWFDTKEGTDPGKDSSLLMPYMGEISQMFHMVQMPDLTVLLDASDDILDARIAAKGVEQTVYDRDLNIRPLVRAGFRALDADTITGKCNSDMRILRLNTGELTHSDTVKKILKVITRMIGV